MPTVFVTGATAGIGRATVEAFAGVGWHVVATGRRRDRLDALASDRVHVAAFDLRDDAARDAALAALPAPFADIDVLVNNAGLALGLEPAQQASLDNWRTMIDTNVTALVSITHALLPGIVARRGTIINLASVAGNYPYPGGNVYAATKAFVRQFSLALRADLHGTGARVSAIEPGMVETEFTTVRTGDQHFSDKLYAGVTPLTAEDIANTILWVATQPPHVNVNTLEIMPTNQSWQGFAVHREGA